MDPSTLEYRTAMMKDPVLILVYIFVAAMISFAIEDANAYIKISSPGTLPSGSIVSINGSSTPSNATRTHCDVAVNLNGGSYAIATPTGKLGAGDYSKWNFTGSPVDTIKAGVNKLTVKYSCFSPTNSTGPDFEYHHSVNVTGT
jgi:hypothetical protein